MADNLDLGKVKRNVSKMVGMGAPEADIDAYIASEGTTIDAVKSFQVQQPSAVMDSLNQFGQGFNKGVYQTVNAPTSLANGLSRLIGSDFRFKRPLEAMAPGADTAIMETSEPATPAGKVASTIGEYTGAAALPAGGMMAAAPRMAASLAGSGNVLGQSVGNMAKSVANAPGRAAMGEVAATAGAGVGASIAREVAPGNPWAETAAATIGGLTPAALSIGPAGLSMRAARKIKGATSPEAKRVAARRDMSDQLNKQMTPEVEASIRQTAAIQKEIPDYKPSIGEATESPDFIATQRAHEQGLSGPELNTATQRYSRNEDAIARAAADRAPASALTPDEAFNPARRRVSDAFGRIDAAEAATARRQQDFADSLPSGQRARQTGATIRDELIDSRARMKEEMSITANEMGLNDPRANLNFGAERDGLIASVQPKSALSDSGALPHDILRDIKRMDNGASIVDMMELRSRVGSSIREAQRMPTGEKRVPYLQKLQAQVDEATERMIGRTDDPELAQRLQEFRKMYREDFIEPFQQGAAGNALKKDITGAYKIPDEQVAKEFFDGWKQTGADQFQRTFRDSAAAHRAMESAAFDDLHNFAVRDGILDPGRVNAWARKNKPVLESFPQINRRVTNLENATNALGQRQAQLAARRKSVEQSALARELKKIDDPIAGETAERVITRAVDPNPARMDRLLKSVKSDEARAAIRRHVWDDVLAQADPLKYLRRNSLSISAALGDKYKVAEKIAMAIQKNKIVPRPSGQPIDTNPVANVEKHLGTGLNQISSRIFAVKSGRTSSRYAMADILGRFFRSMSQNQAKQVMQEILYDPKAATDLANAMQFGAMSKPQAKRLYTFMLSSGIVPHSERED